MSADLHIANLLRLASEDLRGARLLATERNRNAIYLCEQAAEKVILAVLTSEGKHGQHKHQLDQFVDLIPDENPVSRAHRQELRRRSVKAKFWRHGPGDESAGWVSGRTSAPGRSRTSRAGPSRRRR